MAISLKVTKEKRRTIAMELTHHVHNKTSKMYSSIPKGMKSSAAFFRYRPMVVESNGRQKKTRNAFIY